MYNIYLTDLVYADIHWGTFKFLTRLGVVCLYLFSSKSSPKVACTWLYLRLWLTLLFWWWEHFPEAEGLVTCSCHQCLAIGAHGEVQYSVGVARQHC